MLDVLKVETAWLSRLRFLPTSVGAKWDTGVQMLWDVGTGRYGTEEPELLCVHFLGHLGRHRIFGLPLRVFLRHVDKSIET